jgi:hypothetical protein
MIFGKSLRACVEPENNHEIKRSLLDLRKKKVMAHCRTTRVENTPPHSGYCIMEGVILL